MPDFKWEKHWSQNDEPKIATQFASKLSRYISSLLEDKPVASFADFGCGPGSMLFILAEQFPDTNFLGLDVARSIIEKNQRKALDLGLKNLQFSVDSLPFPSLTDKFDYVSCFSTLHYLEEIEFALTNLFNMVADDGLLLFNYPNVYTLKNYQRDLSPEDIVMRKRFKALLSGKNILTQKQVEKIIGVRPQKFYSSIRGNIYVKIIKPKR